MGEQNVTGRSDADAVRLFVRKVLEDVQALERMLADGQIESGKVRIGAEQELFLIDRGMRPAPVVMQLLEAIDDPHFTTELASFNLECNLDPLPLDSGCFYHLQRQLEELVSLARQRAAELGVHVVLSGILPTLEKGHLDLDHMTPLDRYRVLNDAVFRLRGGPFRLHLRGRDELSMTHDNVMLEAANTSFQVHLQVDPDDFARLYNLAQLATAPALAAATNSPLLFGRQLWRETRIALFQQAVDTRPENHMRRLLPRVRFGDHWLDSSVLEIFRRDIARYKVLLTREIDESSLTELDAGRIPRLKALCIHNGTVYRWNRPCYGISDGKPHLRIENRTLPAGPSIVDEVANAAFWLGLVKGLADQVGDVRELISFDAVRANFLAAARLGLNAQMHWLDGSRRPVAELLASELIPLARQGLVDHGIGNEEADRYLDVFAERVENGQTGSQWQIASLAAMGEEGTRSERVASLTAGLLQRQAAGRPGHTWELARMDDSEDDGHPYHRVASLMSTDLFTVNEDELIDLVAFLMDWRHIRHVPVEDNEHRLVGLVTHRSLLRFLAREYGKPARSVAVKELMHRELITATPATGTLEALDLMRRNKVSCLPVVEGDRLVGMLSERDFMQIATRQLEEFLSP